MTREQIDLIEKMTWCIAQTLVDEFHAGVDSHHARNNRVRLQELKKELRATLTVDVGATVARAIVNDLNYPPEACNGAECLAKVERKDGNRCGGVLHGVKDGSEGCGRFFCDDHL